MAINTPAIAQEEYDKILNGEDYFHCEKRNCRMRRQVCVDNQRIANQPDKHGFGSRRNVIATDRSYTCLDCEQGKEIKRKLEGNMEALKHLCKQCGENEIIVKKATGEPLSHGLCRQCFGDKIRAYHADKKKDKPSSKQRNHVGIISVDFNEYPRVLEAIRQKAIREVRTVEEQILWECMGGVGKVGEGKGIDGESL